MLEEVEEDVTASKMARAEGAAAEGAAAALLVGTVEPPALSRPETCLEDEEDEVEVCLCR